VYAESAMLGSSRAVRHSCAQSQTDTLTRRYGHQYVSASRATVSNFYVCRFHPKLRGHSNTSTILVHSTYDG